MFLKLSREEVESKKSARGGFTRKQLAAWGVPWPPPKGWRRQLEGARAPHDMKSKRLDMPAWNYSNPEFFEAEKARLDMKSLYQEKSGDYSY
jgi:hypothetical protein